MRLQLTFLVAILVCAASGTPSHSYVGHKQIGRHPTGDRKLIVCYFESWAVYRPGKGLYDVENIDPNLCSHGMYAFAGLDAATNKIISLDPYNDLYVEYGLGAFYRFTNLTKKNPDFIPMLSVGGWNEGSIKYSRMASAAESRQAFVDSALDFLDKYNFKGLDLDWEYPTRRGGLPQDKANYVQLLKELREAFDPKGYLLSAAVSAGKDNIDHAYDIPSVSQYLHFINLMAYDYHGDWEQWTGEDAPLYPRPDEYGDNALLNVDFSVNYWIDGGAPPEKLILGLPLYGRTFTLADPNQNGFYAPITGSGQPGPYTEEAGDMGYNEICEALGQNPTWPIITDPYYRAPYTYHDNQWIGYDDAASIREKCDYANQLNLGGAMVWSIDTDDFLGVCGGIYPLMSVVTEVIWNGATPSPPQSTTPYTGPTTTRATTTRAPTTPAPSTPNPSDICKKSGYQADPNDCTTFYDCIPNADGTWTVFTYHCSSGTVFDPSIDSCNYAANVPDCHADI